MAHAVPTNLSNVDASFVDAPRARNTRQLYQALNGWLCEELVGRLVLY